MSADKSTSNVDINSLPNEIIIKIIRLCLVSETPIQPTKRMTKVQVNQAIKREAVGKLDFSRVYRPALGISPNILATCTKLKEVGTEILYTQNVIDFSDSYINTIRPRSFAHRVGHEKARLVNSVCFGTEMPAPGSLERPVTGDLPPVGRYPFRKSFTPGDAVGRTRTCLAHLPALQHVLIENNFAIATLTSFINHPPHEDPVSSKGWKLHCIHNRRRYGADGSKLQRYDLHGDQAQLDRCRLQIGSRVVRYGQSCREVVHGEYRPVPMWEALVFNNAGSASL